MWKKWWCTWHSAPLAVSDVVVVFSSSPNNIFFLRSGSFRKLLACCLVFLLQKDCSNTVYGVGHKFLFLANLTANYIALTSPKVHQKKETCSAVVASLHFETHKLFSFLLIKELFVHCKCQGETNFCPATKTLNHSLSKRLLSGLSLTIITKGCLHTSMKMGSWKLHQHLLLIMAPIFHSHFFFCWAKKLEPFSSWNYQRKAFFCCAALGDNFIKGQNKGGILRTSRIPQIPKCV